MFAPTIAPFNLRATDYNAFRAERIGAFSMSHENLEESTAKAIRDERAGQGKKRIICESTGCDRMMAALSLWDREGSNLVGGAEREAKRCSRVRCGTYD